MPQKITTNTAHAEIAKDIRLAKQRMFREHSKGVPLGEALQGFIAEVNKSVGEQETLLASENKSRKEEPEAPAADLTESETADSDASKVFVSETDFNEIAHQLLITFEHDEERMAPAVVLLNYLWLALNKKLFTDTPYPLQIDPSELVERVMRGIISRTIEGEQLEQFGNEALKAFRKESRRLAPRSKGGDA